MNIFEICKGIAPSAESMSLKDGGEMIVMRDSSVEEYKRVCSAVSEAGFKFDSDVVKAVLESLK